MFQQHQRMHFRGEAKAAVTPHTAIRARHYVTQGDLGGGKKKRKKYRREDRKLVK